MREDLRALERLVAMAAGPGGAASLSLNDQGGPWYHTACGVLSGSWMEHPIALEGSDVEGLLRVKEGTSGAPPEDVGALLIEILRLRRLGAERRRQPRGPEGASFVPGVVHELRNFLFAMGAGLDAFEARFAGKTDESAHAEALRRNLTRLQGFLEELGEYGNPGGLSFASAALQPVLQQALSLAEPLAQAHGVRLTSHIPDVGATERMDRPALEGSLRRLLELVVLEAQSGEVRVASHILEGPGRPWAEVTISGTPTRDRGLDMERLFEPFHYRDKAMSRLGPAIARRTIEAHGGQLAAALEAGGFMLRVMLPVWLEARP